MSFTLSNRPLSSPSSSLRRRLELLCGQGGSELFEELVLLLVQLLRGDGPHGDHQVALAAAAHVGHAPSLQADVEPVCVLSGIFTVSSPSMPGTTISPPRASVVKESGTSQCRSLPSRWKNS